MRFRTRLHKRALAHTHVVSYSPTDAETLAIELARGLETGTPALPAWIEQRDLVPGQDRRDEIAETIRACDSLLFVISRESAADPDLKDDWVRALRYKSRSSRSCSTPTPIYQPSSPGTLETRRFEHAHAL